MMVEPAQIDPAFFEGITEPEYKKFLSEQDNKPWSGSRIGLVRKGQVVRLRRLHILHIVGITKGKFFMVIYIHRLSK
jgi:hypothetical protein